jgi:hypothetical protein
VAILDMWQQRQCFCKSSRSKDEYIPGKQMISHLFTKNLQGPLFKESSRHFVTDEEFEEVEWSHAREIVGVENCGVWHSVRMRNSRTQCLQGMNLSCTTKNYNELYGS